jgi:hypothetical protein
MRLAQIQNDKVVNILIADEVLPDTPTDTYIESETAGIGWVYENGELSPAPIDIDALRHAAYVAESDPIFFKYQREEATKEEWLAKVEEIKARYPKN